MLLAGTVTHDNTQMLTATTDFVAYFYFFMCYFDSYLFPVGVKL